MYFLLVNMICRVTKMIFENYNDSLLSICKLYKTTVKIFTIQRVNIQNFSNAHAVQKGEGEGKGHKHQNKISLN